MKQLPARVSPPIPDSDPVGRNRRRRAKRRDRDEAIASLQLYKERHLGPSKEPRQKHYMAAARKDRDLLTAGVLSRHGRSRTSVERQASSSHGPTRSSSAHSETATPARPLLDSRAAPGRYRVLRRARPLLDQAAARLDQVERLAVEAARRRNGVALQVGPGPRPRPLVARLPRLRSQRYRGHRALVQHARPRGLLWKLCGFTRIPAYQTVWERFAEVRGARRGFRARGRSADPARPRERRARRRLVARRRYRS